MDTYTEYLNTLTVVELRAIARQAGYVGSRSVSRTRKADLVNLVAILSSNDEDLAYAMDAVITEAYQGPASDAGITIGAYLACQKSHTARGEIRISGFWQNERSKMVKVVVFDSGVKQAVSKGDATYYTGEKFDMPTNGNDVTCECCGETYFVETGDPRNFDSIDALKTMIAAMKPLADKALAACEATSSGPVRDMHYQTYQDMIRAMDEMTRSLAYWDEACDL